MTQHTITFQPSGRTLDVPAGITILEAAIRAGISIEAPCGGGGTCAKCRVRVASGDPLPQHGACRLTEAEHAAGWRLACATIINGPLIVEVPGARAAQILTSDTGVSVALDPLLPPDAVAPMLGVAFDLGTTTVVGTLFDLATGLPCAVASDLNGQIAHGDDVVARIRHARENSEGARQLQTAVLKTLNKLLSSLTEQANVSTSAIYAVTLAGNTAMQQLLLGRDSRALGEVPFAPAFHDAQNLHATEIGLLTNPAAHLYVFPQVGGFVGGDTVSCMLAANFDAPAEPALLIDIGTNGEIALVRDGEILCASTAAGPAFEGARISCGMRATTGAIDQITLRDNDIACRTIGNAEAVGLCGTALIDVAAELLRAGILDETGRLLEPGEAAHLSPALRARVTMENDAPAFRLDANVLLRQQDIRELQLATAAIRAGVETLLKLANLTPDDLGRVCLAGAFGNLIRPANAQRIGLLPAVSADRIRFIGNASSLGAKTALLNRHARDRAESLRRVSRHIDLGSLPDFQDAFVNAILFPTE